MKVQTEVCYVMLGSTVVWQHMGNEGRHRRKLERLTALGERWVCGK